MIFIGIDPGTHTGFAVWDAHTREFLEIETLQLHRAIERVKGWKEKSNDKVVVVFEDARQRKWFTGNATAKMQGAGSVKRDCNIWEEFCNDYGIRYIAVPPQKGQTKMSPELFKTYTNWKSRTSNHARDAAMLVLGR